MSDSPERIWLLPHDGEQRCWCDHPDPSGMGHEDEADEYIRADLVATLEAENQRLREALTPSGETKYAYIGTFSWTEWVPNENGIEQGYKRTVPWTTIKEIMAAIRARAALHSTETNHE